MSDDTTRDFGSQFGSHEGETVHEVTLTSDTAEARVITWGAVIRDLLVTDREGQRRRVVLGLETLDDYVAHSPYFGSIAGRCG
ncbi:MAG: galactose-1-epimerase, partial [Pseudomonadota bacterium]